MIQYTILIAEDDDFFLNVLIKQFEKNNCVVYRAENGAKAWELYKNYTPHAVLMDIDMPEKNGTEVLQLIRQKDIFTPVFIMTNYHLEEQDALNSLNSGATSFIRKNTSYKEIVSSIYNQLKIIYPVPKIIYFGSMELNMTTYILKSPTVSYILQERQAKVMYLLANNLNNIVNSSEIHRAIWGEYQQKNQQMVKNTINFLREILREEYIVIEAVYGKGYILKIQLLK